MTHACMCVFIELLIDNCKTIAVSDEKKDMLPLLFYYQLTIPTKKNTRDGKSSSYLLNYTTLLQK